MTNIPEGLYYSKDHEWVRVEGDIGTVGITDHAQKALGEVVYVDLPKVGEVLNAKQEMGVVESVKSASPVYTPVSGEVVEVNAPLTDEKEEKTPLVNNDPYGEGWLIRMRLTDKSQLDGLLSAAEYEEFLQSRAEDE